MPEFGEKTEQATPKRKQKARESGQVARSRELISMTSMAGVMLVFYFAGGTVMRNLALSTGRFLSLEYGRDPLTVMRAASYQIFTLMAPFLGISFVFALATGFAQGGLVLKPLSVNVDKLNPVNGFTRIFSKTGLVELVKSLFKFSLGGAIFYFIIKKALAVLPYTAALDIRDTERIGISLISKSVLYAFGAFFVIAIADYIAERWNFGRSIRMTKDEIKEEYKETEGDPAIKARIKSLQREMARKRMMQDVPKATVVITNPTHLAVALFYKNKETAAPKVIAKGAGVIAEKIKEVAREHGIPVVEDKPVARALFKLEIGSYIPEELYKAVAGILAFIYKLKRAGC
ncbi:MAG: flagellar biosynthesis protein FlhB [Nitrospiraceae bacterium]|nr:flagellar biosynthesis protein FlhB [Nitrospiraceae bacterium]